MVTLEMIYNDLQVVKQEIQNMQRKSMSKNERHNFVLDKLKERGSLCASDVQSLVKISRQQAHNIMDKFSTDYPELIRLDTRGRQKLIVYFSDADKKKKGKILELISEREQLSIRECIEMFQMNAQSVKLVFQDLENQHKDIQYIEDTTDRKSFLDTHCLVKKKASNVDDPKDNIEHVSSNQYIDMNKVIE